jgi:CheY-like chemotaxis protein
MCEPSFLYVEDDRLSRKVMDVMIKQVLGYQELAIFENSADFLERVEALPHIPSVIFLDVQIAPYDGYALLDMLHGDPRYADVTIIAMTANVMSNDVEQLIAMTANVMSNDVEQLQRAGFNGLIGKPLIKDIFPELVTRILAGESIWYIP